MCALVVAVTVTAVTALRLPSSGNCWPNCVTATEAEAVLPRLPPGRQRAAVACAFVAAFGAAAVAAAAADGASVSVAADGAGGEKMTVAECSKQRRKTSSADN